MGEMRADGAKIKDQSGIFALLRPIYAFSIFIYPLLAP